jgi:glycosyltransferase involved in cell wall biosynthesis
MRNVCLVTNYNYASYLPACLLSITSQTVAFDHVIIVDDGSTDNSRDIISSFSQTSAFTTPLFKANGGQLSCFNAARELINTDDLVYFLDSDDVYPCDYLELVSRYISLADEDFFFTKPVAFKAGEKPLQYCNVGDESPFTFHSTSALTRIMSCWIGAVTSSLCIRGSLFRTIFPYPYEEDWITRADDVLIFGASIIGVHKLYIPSLAINYRMHSANNFIGKQISDHDKVDWRLRHERLFHWFSEKAGVPRRPPLKNALHEAAIIPKSIRLLLEIPSPGYIFLFDLLVFAPIFKIIFKDMIGLKRV